MYTFGDTVEERSWSDMRNRTQDMQEAYRERREQRELLNRAFARNLQTQVEELEALDDSTEEEDAFEPYPRGMNICAPILRAVVAEKLAMRPNIQLSSSQSDYGTRTKADLMTRLVRGWMRNGVFDMEEVRRAVTDSEAVGLSFIKYFWDPSGGRPIPASSAAKLAAGVYETDPFGAPVEVVDYEGEIGTMYVPTNDGLPNINARRWSEVTDFAHVRLLPIRQLLDMFETDHFGEAINVRAMTLSRSSFTAQEAYREVQQDDYTSNLMVSAVANTLVEFVEYWELPSREFPNGRFAQWAGNVLFYIGPNPLTPKRIPFEPYYGENLVPGSLYADGTIEYLKSVQSDVNMASRKMREWFDLQLNGKWLVPMGSGVDMASFQNRSGIVVEHRLGHQPKQAQVADIPNGMFSYLGSRIEQANFLAGHDEVSRGQLPQGKDVSGRAIAFITEQEQKNRTPNLMSYVLSVYRGLQQCLWLAKQYYQDGRHARMLGENKRWQWEVLRLDDFDMTAEIVYDMQSAVASTPAVRFNAAMDLFAAGGLEDGPAQERLRNLIGEDYESGPDVDDSEIDREKARRFIMMVKANPFAQLNTSTVDDPLIHIREYSNFRKTPEFEALAPEQQQKIVELTEYYEQLDMYQQMVAAGAPPAPGAPTAPPDPSQFSGGVAPPGAGSSPGPAPVGGPPGPARASPFSGGEAAFEPSVTAAERGEGVS